MDGSTLPRGAPLLRRHAHGDGFGYGWLLILILVSITFQLAAPETDVAQVITIFLQGFTLIAALHVSGVRRWLIHLAVAITAVALLAATGMLIGSGELDDGAGRVLGLMFVVLAPTAIVAGIVRQARRDHMITRADDVRRALRLPADRQRLRLRVRDHLRGRDGAFFAEISRRRQLRLPVLQLLTMTTTGYGDLTAAQDLGRSLAITEALIGQIYLVTVVAVIVSNIGRTRIAGR